MERYRERHNSEIKARRKARRAKDPEAAREYERAWRASNRERDKEAKRAWAKANPDKVRAQQERGKKRAREKSLKALYGITVTEYDTMHQAQGGRCAACGDVPDGNLSIDHCHETGRVRGLLCSPCNLALGSLREDPSRIAGLLAYARAHARTTASMV
jgi:hypothetical protein